MKGITTIAVALGSFAGGVCLGILMAPQSGRETREQISTRVRGELSRLEGQLSNLETHLEELEDQITQISGDIRQKIRDKAEHAVDQVLPTIPDDPSVFKVEGGELEQDLRRMPRS